MPKIIQILRRKKTLYGLDDEGKVWATTADRQYLSAGPVEWDEAVVSLEESAQAQARLESELQLTAEQVRAERLRCNQCPECGAMLEKREDGSPICVVCTVRAAEALEERFLGPKLQPKGFPVSGG